MIEIIRAESDEHIEYVRELFQEYEKSLGFDLCFQDFADELAHLPGEYAPPNGCLLLAKYIGEIVGCVALRKLEQGICEMKRLYVKQKFRKKGIGRQLAEEIIKIAHHSGYSCMRLDTISTMKEANKLYESLGFKMTRPYRYNPIPGALYMELVLDNTESISQQ
jgi:ribosomal protein S18 acetylase RimI-like enzyme